MDQVLTDFTYDDEARRRDAVIAKAMGWQVAQGTDTGDWFGWPPKDSRHRERKRRAVSVPQYHADRDALAEALDDLTRDPERWERFLSAAWERIGFKYSRTKLIGDAVLRRFMFAPPHILAQALAKAIEEGK